MSSRQPTTRTRRHTSSPPANPPAPPRFSRSPTQRTCRSTSWHVEHRNGPRGSCKGSGTEGGKLVVSEPVHGPKAAIPAQADHAAAGTKTCADPQDREAVQQEDKGEDRVISSSHVLLQKTTVAARWRCEHLGGTNRVSSRSSNRGWRTSAPKHCPNHQRIGLLVRSASLSHLDPSPPWIGDVGGDGAEH
jgi:hypothetical protein